jgi:hypothetical protein
MCNVKLFKTVFHCMFQPIWPSSRVKSLVELKLLYPFGLITCDVPRLCWCVPGVMGHRLCVAFVLLWLWQGSGDSNTQAIHRHNNSNYKFQVSVAYKTVTFDSKWYCKIIWILYILRRNKFHLVILLRKFPLPISARLQATLRVSFRSARVRFVP